MTMRAMMVWLCKTLWSLWNTRQTDERGYKGLTYVRITFIVFHVKFVCRIWKNLRLRFFEKFENGQKTKSSGFCKRINHTFHTTIIFLWSILSINNIFKLYTNFTRSGLFIFDVVIIFLRIEVREHNYSTIGNHPTI